MSSLQSFDALISPVAPTAAWKLGEKIDDPLSMYKSDIMTVNINLAGKSFGKKSHTLFGIFFVIVCLENDFFDLHHTQPYQCSS